MTIKSLGLFAREDRGGEAGPVLNALDIKKTAEPTAPLLVIKTSIEGINQ